MEKYKICNLMPWAQLPYSPFNIITADDIKQIPFIKEIISNNINEMKAMM